MNPSIGPQNYCTLDGFRQTMIKTVAPLAPFFGSPYQFDLSTKYCSYLVSLSGNPKWNIIYSRDGYQLDVIYLF